MGNLNKRARGAEGEILAIAHLKSMGFEIVETNYQFGHGEIDIIAKDGDVLVFCEVKTRHNDNFGPPECAVTPRKQQQLRKVALGYLFQRDIKEQACRFDVIGVRMYGGEPALNYIPNAF